MSETRHYLRFQLGHEWYGVEVDCVVEVLHFMALDELPVSRPDVLGLMRLREAVVPIIDLRLRFGLPTSYNLNTPIIVTDTPLGLLGLVVDDVDDLEPVDPAQITPHDSSLSRYVTAIARRPDSLLLLLDIAALRTEIPVL